MMEILQFYVSGFWVWLGLTVALWIAMASFGMAAGFVLGLVAGKK